MQTSASMRSRVGIATVVAVVGLSLITAPSPASAAERTAISITKIAASSGKTVIAGETLVLTGKASANLKGKKLTVQAKIGKSWKTLGATPKVSSKRTFTAKVKTVGLGKTTYRVLFPGTTKGRDLGKSNDTRSTTVWKWFPLADQRIVEYKASYGWYEPYPTAATVAGVYYPNALVGRSKHDRVAWSDFNLSFQCKQFRSLAGTDDTSPASSSGTSFVSIDGVTPGTASVPLKLGKPTPLTLNVTDAMRLRLSVVSPNKDVVKAVWANAKILCKQNVNPKD
ncbi:NPCBM/NEW2 domain-containing protein [Microbacterium sp. 179-B 1A2 NHS]|uniref:NPCBM/NEW2 domain-containing protein n=1 Tax=Microbacterium sp. 179-B 1A2 NHS TaxID=3142383 RepID=UPI0039A3A34D